MNILMISPQSPPKNTPESMQVSRYLQELDKEHQITLVNTPADGGWSVDDSSIDVILKNTHIITMKLWFHKVTLRFLHSRLLKHFLLPDETAWIRYMTSYILRKNISKPDIIYSRSVPFSAALLAKDLKFKLQVPWIMHLSDPWFDSPYRVKTKYEKKLAAYEFSCFKNADSIMLTTESTADFYKKKYPQFSEKINVSRNVMPSNNYQSKEYNKNKKLTLMYAGALYGDRRATTLLEGLSWLKEKYPKLLKSVKIFFIGNMTEEIKAEINSYGFEQVLTLGKKTYAEVLQMQVSADILISLEPDGKSPLLKTFMPSKVLDYIASNKPILAITPENSETWKLCEKGFGWHVKSGDRVCCGTLLSELIKKHTNGEKLLPVNEPPEEYTAAHNAERLVRAMKKLIANDKKKSKEN